jgi:hypothetical protein
MRKQDIEITISPTGEVSFTVKGVKGSSCVDETKFLEEAMGGVIDRERTAEYYEESQEGYLNRWSGGGEDGDDD